MCWCFAKFVSSTDIHPPQSQPAQIGAKTSTTPLPTWPLGSAERLPCGDFGVQILQHALLSDFVWLFHLEFLLNGEARFLLGDGQYRSLHKWVHHSVLDGLPCGRRTREDEEHRADVLSFVGVLVPKECKTGLGRGEDLGQLCDGARGR